MKLARARAALQARDFVVPDDVKAVAVAALAHRVSLKPELWIQSLTTDEAVHECLDTVPVPSAAELAREP
jgi:MoxR-like ATPase